MVLLGTGNSFNISDVVGINNVSNYSIDDFICVPDTITYNGGLHGFVDGNETGYGNVSVSLQKNSDYAMTYDNTTGEVTITTFLKITIKTTVKRNGASAQESFTDTISITPKVYFCARS